jgi:restriction endonuclease Mrr
MLEIDGDCARSSQLSAVLIGGEMPTTLMVQNNIGVSNVISSELRNADYDFFAKENPYAE